ncbi:hypothetical protein A0J61_02005 [Choanephora cucurbitarum]|uniref:Uncharacterized protein n=1 Tax=Choanephora cucurbitarum TaxID=101091 RepID=A0A1C7NLB4_9FUNG|nr:hypothetical protein A0J61_02005 [Choanephora cucurbitarum]
MLRTLQVIAIVLITASFILQMLTLLGNFRGLRSVYIARIILNYPSSSGSNIFDGFFGGLQNSVPNYFTLALFVVCQEINSDETICSPSSFGFRYGILQVLQNQIPSSLQTTISSVQKGVFIPSVVICFVLWCYAILCLFLLSRRDSRSIGCINRVLIILLALIAFLFCLATFVAQMIVYNLLQSGVQSLMTGSFGSLIDNLVVLTTERGRSIWLSLAAFIALFIAFILICITSCPCGRRRKRGTEDAYEMSRV